jgi:hypothetical protein
MPGPQGNNPHQQQQHQPQQQQQQQQHEGRLLINGAPAPPIQPYQIQSTPRAPPQWYDKFIDALIGEEGPETKYALICHHCSSHNGLILPSEVDTIRK